MVTVEVREALRLRDRAYHVWRLSHNNDDYSLFKTLRNRAKSIVRRAKMSFFEAQFTPGLSVNKLWRRIKRTGLSGNSNEPLQFDPDTLNSHFTNVTAPSPTSAVAVTPPLDHDAPEFAFRCLEESDIRASLLKIKSGAVGSDCIPLDLMSY